jgi:hypothetical protein
MEGAIIQSVKWVRFEVMTISFWCMTSRRVVCRYQYFGETSDSIHLRNGRMNLTGLRGVVTRVTTSEVSRYLFGYRSSISGRNRETFSLRLFRTGSDPKVLALGEIWTGFETKHFSSNSCVQTSSEAHPASYPMGTGIPVNDEWERMWKESVVA